MVEHVDIPDGERHEPKGAGSASSNEVYFSDGANSGAWAYPSPHGGWRYTAIGSGTTFSTPTSYEVMNVVGTTTHLKLFTHNALGRLTYTGTAARHLHLVMDITFKHSAGAGVDCFFDVYKNGSGFAEVVHTADSGDYQKIALHADSVVSTNDYFEVYLKVGSGSIIVHQAYMFALGMPD